MPLDKSNVSLGMRVQNHNALCGTIRWIGRLEKKDKPPGNDHGTYIGVEYDEATHSLSRNDGEWNGVRYFTCPAGTGEFHKPKEYSAEMNPQAIRDLRAKFGPLVASLSDTQLIKFCVARRFDMPKVCVMIEKYLQWVATFKPSADEYFPDGMKDDYPGGYSDALDLDNNLIWVERPGHAGRVSPAEFVARYGLPVIARWHVCGMEMGKRIMAEGNYKSKRVTYIVDLTNLGDCGTPMLKFSKTIAAIDQDNFPEHLARVFVCNAPSFFSSLWKLIRFFLDDRTKDKVFILETKEQRETLLKYIAPDALPSVVGGTNDSWMRRGGRIGSDDPSRTITDATTAITEATDEEIAAAAKAS